MSIEQNLEVSLLLEIYGNLLTQKQQDILSEFYNDNISISEIAQTHDSSRQAVNDLIKRSVKVLQDYEKKLHLLKKFVKIKTTVNDVLSNNPRTENNKPFVEALNKILEDM